MSDQETARLEEQVKTLFMDVGELKDDIKCIKDQLANRLPVWATITITVLAGAVGWFAK